LGNNHNKGKDHRVKAQASQNFFCNTSALKFIALQKRIMNDVDVSIA
jgi:hypothetical protein